QSLLGCARQDVRGRRRLPRGPAAGGVGIGAYLPLVSQLTERDDTAGDRRHRPDGAGEWRHDLRALPHSQGHCIKITQRLIAQELVGPERLPNNRKELLFRLTPLGRDLFELRHAFDEQMERGFMRFLQRYDVDALRLLVNILRDATEASFL